MTQKNLLIVLALLTIIIFSGCTKTVYVDVPVPYAVPTPCKVPKVDCDFSGDGSEPIVKLLECIVNQKKAMSVCK